MPTAAQLDAAFPDRPVWLRRVDGHAGWANTIVMGLAGVEAAALHKPDAIILDIRMPDITGYDACQRIHRLPDLKGVPVLFLSANVQYDARQKAIEAGGTAFLSKPFEASDILDAIDEMLAPAA